MCGPSCPIAFLSWRTTEGVRGNVYKVWRARGAPPFARRPTREPRRWSGRHGRLYRRSDTTPLTCAAARSPRPWLRRASLSHSALNLDVPSVLLLGARALAGPEGSVLPGMQIAGRGVLGELPQLLPGQAGAVHVVRDPHHPSRPRFRGVPAHFCPSAMRGFDRWTDTMAFINSCKCSKFQINVLHLHDIYFRWQCIFWEKVTLGYLRRKKTTTSGSDPPKARRS